MPSITKGDYVLVSGASGYVATHIVRTLLREGYRVRGTVRSSSKGDYLENLFRNEGKFDYVIVEDIIKEGAFDEAVKGVDAVAHTASPFYMTNVKDPQELIEPATKGTTGILKSVQKNNPKCKRVVITSSIAAIISPSRKAPVHYTEEDWNIDSIPHVEKNGLQSEGSHSYRASKTLAEQVFWKFIKDEKPNWDGVTINPPMVIGEVIHECESPDKLNTSVANFYAWAAGEKKESDLPEPGGDWVNVHSVAISHVHALTKEAASGQRFICSAGRFWGQDYCDILHKHYPDLKNIPIGKPNTHDELAKSANVFDGTKASKLFGFEYENLEDTVVEMCNSLRRRYKF